MPVFNHVPILFYYNFFGSLIFFFASYIITKIKMPTNIHRVPIFFFPGFSHPSTFSYLVPELFLFSHPRESLIVKMTCRTTIVSSTNKYYTPNYLLLKKEKEKTKRKRELKEVLCL